MTHQRPHGRAPTTHLCHSRSTGGPAPDPPTSPVKYRDQIVCGAIVATVGYAVFMWVGAAYYLLAGVLVGNVWEAWRRVSRRTGVAFPRGTVEFLREVSPWRRTTLTPMRS